MSKTKTFILFLILTFCVMEEVIARTETLSERASNPITNLSQLQFENDFTPKNYGSKECSNAFSIKPLLAFDKTNFLPFEQLIRVKIQVPTLPFSAATHRETALGDTQIFDLFIIEEPSWGRWGIGPMAVLPTASNQEAGARKWQLGPALGVSILKFTNWQIGFLAQNPISFKIDSRQTKQNYCLFQPFIIYHFRKNTYFVSNGEWTIDWISHTKQIPINIGIGHTTSFIGHLKLDISLQYQYMAYQNAAKSAGFVNQSTIQLSFSILGE